VFKTELADALVGAIVLMATAETGALKEGVETPTVLTERLRDGCCLRRLGGGELLTEQLTEQPGRRVTKSLLFRLNMGLLLRSLCISLCILSPSSAPIHSGSEAFSHVLAGSSTEGVGCFAIIVATVKVFSLTGSPIGADTLPPGEGAGDAFSEGAGDAFIKRVTDVDRGVGSGAMKDAPVYLGTGTVAEPR
jgi:hypothetical protein